MQNSVGGGCVHSLYDEIISLENLFAAWSEFRRGKMKKCDVQAFAWKLEDEIFRLHADLKDGTYQHGSYESFFVCDPKRRHIHKPSVRDRLVHHAVVRVIEPLFDRSFIFDVWSCRKNKGTHGAVDRFQRKAWKLSRNDTRTVWVLKLDIRKFFAEVDQGRLIAILNGGINDGRTMMLIVKIVKSFHSGLPLGNLTSQLFANVYLNELDRFITQFLQPFFYIRYCDDFILTHTERDSLILHLPQIRSYLLHRLGLTLHPNKITLKPYHRGIDFLGFVCFPHYRILRTKTKRRLLKKINRNNVASYAGLLKHCRSRGILKDFRFKE